MSGHGLAIVAATKKMNFAYNRKIKKMSNRRKTLEMSKYDLQKMGDSNFDKAIEACSQELEQLDKQMKELNDAYDAANYKMEAYLEAIQADIRVDQDDEDEAEHEWKEFPPVEDRLQNWSNDLLGWFKLEDEFMFLWSNSD